jgi:hypothetical protein
MREQQPPGAPGATGGAGVCTGPAALAEHAKALATLQARAALAGWALASFTEPDGRTSYSLSKWGRPLTLPDLAAVALHLRRVGAPE